MKVHFKIIGFLFIVALVLRIAGLIFFTHLREKGLVEFPAYGADSQLYVQIGKNIFTNHIFSANFSLPLEPTSLVAPLYPFFVGWMHGATNTLYSIIWLQIFFGSAFAVLVYLLGRRFFSPFSGLIGGIFVAMDPIGIFLSNVILSEVLYTVCIGVALYFLFLWFEKRMISYVIFAALCFGLATLMRPIGQFIFLISLVWLLIYCIRFRSKNIFMQTGIYAMVFLLTLSPWFYRNYKVFHAIGIADIGIYNFYAHHLPLYYQQWKHLPRATGERMLEATLAQVCSPPPKSINLSNSSCYSAVVRNHILKQPLEFVAFYTVKVVPFFITDGLRDLALKLKIIRTDSVDITGGLLKGDIKSLFLGQAFFLGALLVLGVVFWIFICGLCFVVGLQSLKAAYKGDGHSEKVIFLLLCIFIVGVLTGPVANARLRFPVAFMMVMIAAYGAEAFWLRYRSKYIL